ncbi:MAG: YfbK domain-containing protein [Eggerthellaceae bacterium]
MLGGTSLNLVPLADDVKIQVEFNPDRVKGYRLIGYENPRARRWEFRDDAGEVGAGHAFTVAYEIVPAGSAFEVGASASKYGSDADDRQDGRRSEANGGEWLTCTMRYRPAGTVEAVEQALVVDDESCTDDPNGDWTFAAAVIECGMALHRSPHAGAATLESARDLLASCELTDQQQGFKPSSPTSPAKREPRVMQPVSYAIKASMASSSSRCKSSDSTIHVALRLNTRPTCRTGTKPHRHLGAHRAPAPLRSPTGATHPNLRKRCNRQPVIGLNSSRDLADAWARAINIICCSIFPLPPW